MEQIPASEFNAKLRTNEDLVNFFRESGTMLINIKGKYFPSKPGFDKKFVVQVLKGDKLLLPLGFVGGLSFRYYTKSNNFTKDHILQYFRGDVECLKYLPDDVKLKTWERDFLLSVLFCANKPKYLQLYSWYKKISTERINSKASSYEINICQEYKGGLKKYTTCTQNKNAKGLQVKKGGEDIAEIKRMNQNERAEINIPKDPTLNSMENLKPQQPNNPQNVEMDG